MGLFLVFVSGFINGNGTNTINAWGGGQFSHIQPEALSGQLELFDFADDGLQNESRPLMKTVDQINRRFPQGISIAATDFKKTWKPKAERISLCYTTNWQELMTVNCG